MAEKTLMRYFCTYFDHRYLVRGLALYGSLREHCPESELWVLCLSDQCHGMLKELALPSLYPVSLPEFERGDEALLEAKAGRNMVEYYFTCTPSLPLYVFNQRPEADMVTYLDADLFFFRSPELIFDEIGSHSIAIIAHRFSPHLAHLAENGTYNVGWVSFRRDHNGLACLQWWRERCIEWCYDRLEGDRYADQKYLDQWPTLFQNLIVLNQKGANLAPWNIANYRIHVRGKEVFVDEDPLVFHHFHALRRISEWLYDAGFLQYGVHLSMAANRAIYAPYANALRQVTLKLPREIRKAIDTTILRGGMIFPQRETGTNPSLQVVRWFYSVLYQAKIIGMGIWFNQYVLGFCWRAAQDKAWGRSAT